MILDEINKNGKINDSNNISCSYSLFLVMWWKKLIKINPINLRDIYGETALHKGLFMKNIE